MKKPYTHILYTLLLSTCLFASGCFSNKEEPKPKDPPKPTMPPETQEGKNTFGCYVNGELWLPGGEGVAGKGITWSHSYHDQFSVAGKKRFQKDNQMQIQGISVGVLHGITGPGLYHLVNQDNTGSYIQTHPECVMRTDTVNYGILEITRWDMDRLIVSGRFSFTVAAPGCDTIRVTDGRFDVKL